MTSRKHLLTIFFILFFNVSFSQNRSLPIDTIVKTNHQTYINGKKITYVAETGTQPVWNKDGIAEASLFYTFYRRTDVSDKYRPIIFSFNGGPGSASVWMHLAYTGPRILKIDDENS